MSSLYIFWDEARLWGLLVRHALQSLGIAYRMVGAAEIGAGILQKNSPPILLVPGGSARHKAEQLGPKGLAAIRDYVHNGGQYLGFCGGAGLGLSGPEGSSLGLCPWKRADYTERLQHLMSGHLRVESGNGPLAGSLADSQDRALKQNADGARLEPMLPVWWPGHFLPDAKAESAGLEVLARYATLPGGISGAPAPGGMSGGPEDAAATSAAGQKKFYGADFWLADLPVSALPPDAFSLWQDLYGLNISPHFLSGQPCVIHGPFGKGGYTLSYSHLETPCSPFANAWLTGLLHELAGLQGSHHSIPEWDLGLAALEGRQAAPQNAPQIAWPDPELARALALLQDAMLTGVEHNLLFIRSPWLIGWRSGLPGAALNNFYAELYTLLQSPPTPQALDLWHRHRQDFMRDMEFFATGVKNCLLAERLALTLSKSAPEAISTPLLRAQRDSLFGSPMRPGGLYAALLRILDPILFAQLQ